MENKQTMNVSVLKHTGKSVMSDDSSKRINIKMLETNPSMTMYEANVNAYGLIMEETDNGLWITLTKGGQHIKSMSREEFIERLTK